MASASTVAVFSCSMATYKNIAVIGAGVVGCEYATVFGLLGQTQVELFDRQSRVVVGPAQVVETHRAPLDGGQDAQEDRGDEAHDHHRDHDLDHDCPGVGCC